MEGTETRELDQRPITKKSSFRFWKTRRFITVGSLGLAIVQGVCATAVFLSGIGTALGFSPLLPPPQPDQRPVFTLIGSGFRCWLLPGSGQSSILCFYGMQNGCAGTRPLVGECVLLLEKNAGRNGSSSVHPSLPCF